MAAAALIVIGFLVFAAAGGSGTGRIAGAGSTFVDPILQHASTAYQGYLAADRIDVAEQSGQSSDWVGDTSAIEYDPIGSIGGLVRLDDPRMSFAATEVPLSGADLAERSLAQFPIIMGAAAPVVNLDLGGLALTLDPATLSGIYTGLITDWSDAAIAALNPGLALPAGPIAVLYRSDGSGTTWTFTGYLARDPDWTAGRAAQLDWSVGEGVEGTRNLIAAVGSTPGAIGYAEVGQARRAGLVPVRLVNAAGKTVEASPPSIRAAATDRDWVAPDAMSGSASTSQNPAAWPMAATVHVVMRRDGPGADTRRTLAFLDFFYAEAGRSADRLGFVALPPEAVDGIETYWTRAFALES